MSPVHCLMTKQGYFSLEWPIPITINWQTMHCCSSYSDDWSKGQHDGHFDYSTDTFEKLESTIIRFLQLLKTQHLAICYSVSRRSLLPQNYRWLFSHPYPVLKESISHCRGTKGELLWRVLRGKVVVDCLLPRPMETNLQAHILIEESLWCYLPGIAILGLIKGFFWEHFCLSLGSVGWTDRNGGCWRQQSKAWGRSLMTME